MATNQPFQHGSKADIFCKISNVDWETGFSRDVSLNELREAGLALGNGGSWCRDNVGLGEIFNIKRTKHRGTITSVRLTGFNKSNTSKRVSASIRNHFKGGKCVVLAIGGSNIEIDHKDGRKDDTLVDSTLDPVHFQPMNKAVNIAKRTHCNECKASGKRFDARLLGYACAQWVGDTCYQGTCVGCYWYDPYKFNTEVSKIYTKSKPFMEDGEIAKKHNWFDLVD